MKNIRGDFQHETHGDLDHTRVVADPGAWMAARVPEEAVGTTGAGTTGVGTTEAGAAVSGPPRG